MSLRLAVELPLVDGDYIVAMNGLDGNLIVTTRDSRVFYIFRIQDERDTYGAMEMYG